MKNQNIEVEGGELLIMSKEGHYAVIPAKHRQEVMDMIKDDCNNCINNYIQTLPKDSDYAEDGTVVSELYKQKTGKDWSTAKQEGLTTGSWDDNMKLRQRLLSGELDSKQINTKTTINNINNPTKSFNISVENQDYTKAKDFNEAFKIARKQLGANQIFEYQGRKYGTNLKGEKFEPSEEVLNKYNINKKIVTDRLADQNKKVLSPYTSKNTVKLESEYKNWDEKKKDIAEFNKMDQADRIVAYKKNSTDNKFYAVVDKKKGLLHLYKPGEDQPTFSSAVDLGENTGDAQTTTKVYDPNSDVTITTKEAATAKADFNKGNKSTGAGKYYISNIDNTGYGGLPLLNMMNEQQYENYKKTGVVENVATSFHKGYIKDDNTRVSNGCIRCNKTTLDNLSKYLKNTSEVYILPEDEDNEFILENDKLNFKVKSKNNYDEYTDSYGNKQKGQGINRTTNTLNYKPIKLELDEKTFKEKVFQWNDFNDEEEYKKTTQPFVKSLQDNKQKVMKIAQINGDVYNDIAKIAFGIYGNETNFGDTHGGLGNVMRGANKLIAEKNREDWHLPFLPTQASSPDYERKAKGYPGSRNTTGSNNSVGLTQIRWSYIEKEPVLLKMFNDAGITSNKDLLDPEKAALATVLRLAYLVNNRANIDIDNLMETLPQHWGGSSKDDHSTYTKNVIKNSQYLSVKELN